MVPRGNIAAPRQAVIKSTRTDPPQIGLIPLGFSTAVSDLLEGSMAPIRLMPLLLIGALA